MSSTWLYATRLAASPPFTEYVYSNLVWKDVRKVYKEYDGPEDPRNVTYYFNVTEFPNHTRYYSEIEVFRTAIRKW